MNFKAIDYLKERNENKLILHRLKKWFKFIVSTQVKFCLICANNYQIVNLVLYTVLYDTLVCKVCTRWSQPYVE